MLNIHFNQAEPEERVMETNFKDMHCRLCGQSAIDLSLKLANSPRNISRLLHQSELHLDTPIDLSVYECRGCGFVQLAQTLDAAYYEDYLSTVSHSAQMREFQERQAIDFVERFELAGKQIVEVGCGDGNYLSYLRQAGADAVGIEPSSRCRDLAEERGFTVFLGYVGSNSLIPSSPYDGFVARQVLEHVPEPNDFLLGIRKSLLPRAVGLVEVPSLEQAFEGNRFYDFFPDHLNYFSVRTLRYALERNGFEVIEVSRGMSGEFNVALVRVDSGVDFATMQQTVDTLTRELHDFIAAHRTSGKRVAVWGAGGKGIVALAVANIRDVAYVVDSDPIKQGRFTPVSHLPIVSPEMLLRDPVDAVVVTALAYRDEVIKQLHEDLGFTGQIAVLGPRLQVINRQ